MTKLITLLAAFAALCPLLADEPLTVDVPKFDAKIELDGFLRDAVWDKAPVFELGPVKDAVPLGCGTTLRLWRDSAALYLGFRCENPALPLFLKAKQRPDDGPAYADEDLEIFIDIQSGANPTRQFVVNALGSAYDGTYHNGVNADWNGQWRRAAAMVRGAWYAELRIPFSDLGGHPDSVLISCCRVGYGKGGQQWMAAWQAPGWFKPVVRLNLKDK